MKAIKAIVLLMIVAVAMIGTGCSSSRQAVNKEQTLSSIDSRIGEFAQYAAWETLVCKGKVTLAAGAGKTVMVFYFFNLGITLEQVLAEEACRDILIFIRNTYKVGEDVAALVFVFHEMITVVHSCHYRPIAKPGSETYVEVERREAVAIVLSVIPDVQHFC